MHPVCPLNICEGEHREFRRIEAKIGTFWAFKALG